MRRRLPLPLLCPRRSFEVWLPLDRLKVSTLVPPSKESGFLFFFLLFQVLQLFFSEYELYVCFPFTTRQRFFGRWLADPSGRRTTFLLISRPCMSYSFFLNGLLPSFSHTEHLNLFPPSPPSPPSVFFPHPSLRTLLVKFTPMLRRNPSYLSYALSPPHCSPPFPLRALLNEFWALLFFLINEAGPLIFSFCFRRAGRISPPHGFFAVFDPPPPPLIR